MEQTNNILHIDMDAFYASVEVKDDPSLQDRPVLVGGSPEQRGVVAACSYPARQFGIHSAMPMSQALRLCPEASVLPVRMNRYVELSKQIHKIFLNYTPDVEPISIDEAFLDVTGCIQLFGSAESIGKQIKADIKEQTDLTASVGLAPNKFLAKLASDLEKPDGFVIITEENKQQILDPLPVSKIWGIGKVTNKELQKHGIHTIEQLRAAPKYKLSMVFKNQVDDIVRLAQGIDNRTVVPHTEAKSLSAEETFPTDIKEKEVLLGVLQTQVEEVSQRLREEKLECRTITIKFRYGDFRTITRSLTMDIPTNTTQILLQEARNLFDQWYKKSAGALRLLGFGTAGLAPEGTGQKLLFSDPEEEKQKKIDQVYDKIRGKFGDDSLKRGL
ncbi:MAG: DNA polymerase IV [Planctomycetota bacterium]|jgi:DNA polymerase-4